MKIVYLLVFSTLLASCKKEENKPDPEQILLKNMPSAIEKFEQRITIQISKIGNAYVFQDSNENTIGLNETTILDYAPSWKISCGTFGLKINFYILQTLDIAEGIGLDEINVNISDAEFSDNECKIVSDRILNKVKKQLD